jgi:uncharacterized protein YutE (UPF0331/DUF86 family)
VTLRPDVVRERLAFVRQNLAALAQAAGLAKDRFLADRTQQWAAAYGLQVTVQSLLDAGAHVLSAAYQESPRDYGEIVRLLAQHEVLSIELAGALAGLSGFRNILVHEYGAVDFAIVHDKLRTLDDLIAFAAALERWLVAYEQPQ